MGDLPLIPTPYHVGVRSSSFPAGPDNDTASRSLLLPHTNPALDPSRRLPRRTRRSPESIPPHAAGRVRCRCSRTGVVRCGCSSLATSLCRRSRRRAGSLGFGFLHPRIDCKIEIRCSASGYSSKPSRELFEPYTAVAPRRGNPIGINEIGNGGGSLPVDWI